MRTFIQSVEVAAYEVNKVLNRYYYRPMICFLGEHFKGKKLVGAEIGTFRGVNACFIMKSLDMSRLYCIDPYLEYDRYNDLQVNTQGSFNKNELAARKRLKPFKNVVFVKSFSSDCLDSVCDDLDFVYIDGNHEYSFVKKDIELWYPKLKQGGVLGGHDFSTYFSFGVPRAVLEFVKREGLELHGKKRIGG